MRKLLILVTIAVIGLAPAALFGQQSAPLPSPLTLGSAVEYALAHYPAIRAAMERRAAAGAGTGLARTAYLPTATMLWQGNRATHNNIFGLLLPQSVVPQISGPVIPETSMRGAWDSAAGVLLAWEPVDFGYRRANVDAAHAGEHAAAAEVDVSRLGIASATANAFLSVSAAHQAVLAAQADVQRREVFSRSVHVLVDNQLRPGADASRADAELAAARVTLIQAQTAEKVGRAALADFLGADASSLTLDFTSLLQAPPPTLEGRNVAAHPAATAQKAQVDVAAAQLRGITASYYPRFIFQSGISARGTGSNLDGSFAGGTTGLDLQRANWVAGLTAAFPVLDIFAIRARKQIASANENAEVACYQQTIQDLSAQVVEAQATLDGAIAVVQAIPAQLQAARDTESQARARYQAGLANVMEVSEAQSLLVRAETDDALARLNAWRALAGLAVAQGDVAPFLRVVRSLPPGGH